VSHHPHFAALIGLQLHSEIINVPFTCGASLPTGAAPLPTFHALLLLTSQAGILACKQYRV